MHFPELPLLQACPRSGVLLLPHSKFCILYLLCVFYIAKTMHICCLDKRDGQELKSILDILTGHGEGEGVL